MKPFVITGIVILVAANLLPVFLVRPEQQYEGIVAYAVFGAKIKTLDPAWAGDVTSASVQANMYEPLYTYHYLKRPMELTPLLAAEMPRVSPDGLCYTIPLLRGIQYVHDPCFDPAKTREVVAEDLILQLKRVADFHVPSPTWAFFENRILGLDEWRKKSESYRAGDFSRYDLPVEGLSAPDPHTLVIRLKKPYPQLTMVLAMGCAVPMPREAITYYLARGQDIENRGTLLNDHAVGTGPYKVNEWVRGSKIVLVRNKNYRGDVYPSEGTPQDKTAGLLKDAGKACPFVDVWHFEIISEWQPIWLKFLSRQTDAAGIPRQVFETVINTDRDLSERFRKRDIRLIKYTAPTIYWYVFNLDDPLLGKNRKLRQAMSLAFNAQQEIDLLRNGRGRVAVNCIPDSFVGHNEAGPSPYRRFDPAAAKKLLADAGYPDGKGLPEISLDLGGRDRDSAQRGEFFAQQMAQIGIRIKVNLNDWPTLQEKVNKRQCQVYTMGWHADYPDAENFLQLFYSKNASPGPNGSNYANPEYDRLYEKVRVMNDSPRRTALYAKMARMISRDCPVILTNQPEAWVLLQRWYQNMKPSPIGYGHLKYRRIDTACRRRLGGRE